MKSEEWIGFKQGELTIIAFEGLQRFGRGRAARFRFRCSCGKEFSAQKSNVIGRGRMDCGHSVVAKWTIPRGATNDPHYKAWQHMIDRCQNPKNKSFKDYGGRGIKVCDRWIMGDRSKTGFDCFLADMGPRPTIRHTLERIRVTGNYEPGNCMWLPKPDQSKNRRTVRLIRLGDRVKTIPDWCKETGVGYETALWRIKHGWPPEKALTHKPWS